MKPTAPKLLDQILTETKQLGFELVSDAQTGAFLRALAASKPGGKLLEIGTGTGHATAWLLDGMDASARLFTIDINSETSAVAQNILGDDHRLEMIVDDAAAWMVRQTAGSFDLIFADAIPGKIEKLELAWNLLAPGGFYFVDDLLPQPTWPPGHGKAVEQLFANLESISDCTLVNMNWSTGLCVAIRADR